MRDIKTYSPGKLAEALELLAEQGPGISVVSGATDLIVQILEKKKEPRALLDISKLGELRSIEDEDGSIRIGPLATHREIERSAVIRRAAPLLCEAAFLVGSPQIKNIATIGGNIVNASPVADSVPPLMVLGAVLTLKSHSGERRVPVAEFFTGPGTTVLRPDELLTDISFNRLQPGEVSFYERLGQRRLLSISKVGVAFRAGVAGEKMSGVAIALGAVAPKVIMAPRTAAFMEGKSYSAEVAAQAAMIAEGESRGITDIRSTAFYRNRMVGALLIKGLARVMEQ